MRLLWHENGWEDYLWWQTQDKKTIKRINLLIRDMQRSPFDGIGKPEPLRDNLSGWWSRQIEDQAVCLDGDIGEILQALKDEMSREG